ncbi:MAG: CesT family type III secretion system chaperone [Gemmatimonadota bacterium]
MVSRDDLESFLIRMDVDYTEVAEGMFVVRSREGGPTVVLHHSPPLLVARLKVMTLPEKNGLADLYRTLLELNATDIVHGAYGIEGDELILSHTLELETLDYHELQASLESLQLAASGHLDRIRSLASAGVEG